MTNPSVLKPKATDSYLIQTTDYGHRYTDTYLKFFSEKEGKYRSGLVVNVDCQIEHSKDVADYIFAFSNGKGTPNVLASLTKGNVSLVPPVSKYVFLDGYPDSAIYIAKTGTRYFKRGFSLKTFGGEGKMYDSYDPIRTKINTIEYINADFRINFTGTSGALLNSPNVELHNKVASLMYFPKYPSISDALNFFTGDFYLSVPISRQFCLARSSDSKYDVEIYNGVFPFGFYSIGKKEFFIQSDYLQEVIDFLRDNKHYAKISIL